MSTTPEKVEKVAIKMRSAHPPYDTWEAVGYLPFEVHGERFAVTRIPCALNDELQWRATHIETGAAVPKSACSKMEEVPVLLREMAAKSNPEKLRAAVAKARQTIQENRDAKRPLRQLQRDGARHAI